VKELWPRASSSALIAVVSAIEALLEKHSEKCHECGQPKFGIARKFKHFLKTYVPNVEKQFLEEFRAIYETRSHLAHGERVLMADLRPWNYLGDPLQQWQGRFQRNTYRMTATALRNWVLSRWAHYHGQISAVARGIEISRCRVTASIPHKVKQEL
jgi:hypothetical protein